VVKGAASEKRESRGKKKAKGSFSGRAEFQAGGAAAAPDQQQVKGK